MQRTSPSRRLAAAIAVAGLLVATGVVAAWGQTSGTADDKLSAYISARQQLERDDPSMRRALETGDFGGRMDNVRSALRGSQLSADEFVELHQQVQSDPSLRSRVEAQLGAAPGTSGAARGTGAAGPAGGAEAPAGAAPAASPQ